MTFSSKNKIVDFLYLCTCIFYIYPQYLAKISSVIGVLDKLKYIFPAYLLRTIYNSLILPHLNYSLHVWGTQCPNIELLQKKAVRVVNFKSPVASLSQY